IRVRNSQSAELRQNHGLNHCEAFLRAVGQILRGLLAIQTMEQLPGRVAEVEEWLAVFVLQVVAILGDLQLWSECGEPARGREEERACDETGGDAGVQLQVLTPFGAASRFSCEDISATSLYFDVGIGVSFDHFF